MSGGLYRVLGVSRSATKETIRLAYLNLAKKLHPDVNKATGAPQEFQKVRDAYEVLSDEKKKRDYDRQLGGDDSGPSVGQGASSWSTYDRARRSQQGFASGGSSASGGTARQNPAEAMFRRARQQANEDIRSRAQANFHNMNGGFNQGRYQQSVMETFMRFLPLLVPVWMVTLLISLHRRSRPLDQGQPAEMVTHDHTGRAYARDAYGRMHRLPDFDR
ncbi:unnamed protein product [Polarella glacialis]|uniref:J domain-containing protein n=1 Tax=Polarella glacialis TaxID=89957 RepID=A0A813K649_POLGL|nr:unnamed protein product [Polarella glacialis]CAE8693543.1 unnamed protein product [Polarella glacialis]